MVKNFLAMRTERVSGSMSMSSDFSDLQAAMKNLAQHAIMLGGLGGLGTSVLEWAASIAAIYLLVLDRTNWKANILTALLVPYIFFSLPSLIFNIFRGEVGQWIAFVAVVLRLFFPKHFPEYADMPASLILLLAVAPSLLASTVRDSWIGVVICLAIGIYLMQEHIRASGGFKNAFSRANGISNTIGIVIILVFPVWALIFYIL